MRRTRLIYPLIALVALAAASLVQANGFPATLAYYDDSGKLVGEKTSGCPNPQQWGIVTKRYVVHVGCAVSQ